jgi:type IX secretion system PorP/SprF family membrane protein
MISKNNIEEKLFDYFEGGLTSSEQTELNQFIEANPEFKVDFDAWGKSYLPQEEFVYDRADELLVNEKTGKSALFGRWKAGLLMLLVGTGLSFGLFQKINNGQDKRTASAEVEKPQETSQEGSRTDKDDFNSESSNLTVDEGSDAASVINTGKFVSGNDAGAVVSSSAMISGGQVSNVSQTGGSANVNSTSIQQVSGNRNVASSANTSSANTNNSTKLKKLLAKNSRYNHIEIGLETSSVNELLSTPRIKKARSKFEKYDKNELKFQNEKDPFFVIPNGMALGINPSFAGNGKGLRLNYNYNYQWPELNDNYNTHSLSLDTYVKSLHGGVGVILTSDVLGHNKFATKGAELIYSPKLTLFGTTTIEPSVKYGYFQKSVAWNQIKSDMLIDARTGALDVQLKSNDDQLSSSSSSYSNLGFGLLLNTSKLFVGFAYDHLLNANYNFNGLSETIYVPRKLTAHVGGSLVPVKNLDFLILSPSLHFIKVGGYDKVWLSNVVEISRLFLGTSYSFNNEYLFSFGYDNEVMRVSYSYGQTRSMLDQSSKKLSMHQVGLVFNFVHKRR